MKILEAAFYLRDTAIVARELLGKQLVRILDGKVLSGVITETESYGHSNDQASHAYKGQTLRNAAMFGSVGHAYVYFIYGNHFCLNIVARDALAPAGAVLIRTLQPVAGIELMQQNRHTIDIKKLCNGPGKLTQALGINLLDNGVDLTRFGKLYVLDTELTFPHIVAKPRIGLSQEKNKLWRFVVA